MQVKCLNCSKVFNKINSQIKRSPNNYCSRSCSASANNKKSPRRKKTKKCINCENFILSGKKRCKECIKKDNLLFNNQTIKEIMYTKHHKSSAFALIRSRARSIGKKLRFNCCKNCGYDKHYEVCHIKPIHKFSLESKMYEVNNESNLIPLCPNCHWEFDNGLLDANIILQK